MGELKRAQKRRSTMCMVPPRPSPASEPREAPPKPPTPPKPSGLASGSTMDDVRAPPPPPPEPASSNGAPVSKPVAPPKPSLPPKPTPAPKPEAPAEGGAGKPSWRELVRQRRSSKADLLSEAEEAERRAEEERWAGVPEWKRKVLQAKVRGAGPVAVGLAGVGSGS